MFDLATPLCPKCHSRRTARVKRTGFFQTVVLPYLDLYPWECTGCRSVFTFKSRGRLKHRQASSTELPSAPLDATAPRQLSSTVAD